MVIVATVVLHYLIVVNSALVHSGDVYPVNNSFLLTLATISISAETNARVHALQIGCFLLHYNNTSLCFIAGQQQRLLLTSFVSYPQVFIKSSQFCVDAPNQSFHLLVQL